ncbi:hypothetical protein ACFLTP_07720 [Chloroflexota bacterium]
MCSNREIAMAIVEAALSNPSMTAAHILGQSAGAEENGKKYGQFCKGVFKEVVNAHSDEESAPPATSY